MAFVPQSGPAESPELWQVAGGCRSRFRALTLCFDAHGKWVNQMLVVVPEI